MRVIIEKDENAVAKAAACFIGSIINKKPAAVRQRQVWNKG